MAKAIRQTLTEISVKLAGPTDADKKLTDIVAKAAAASKALDVYSEKFRDQQDAALGLLKSLHAFYPEVGPLSSTLQSLSTDSPENVFGAGTTAARIELMGMHLNSAAEGITTMVKRLSNDLQRRVALAKEVEHYTEKVGKLQESYNSARQDKRDAAKEKLESNRSKLHDTADELGVINRAVESLDTDISAVLTPTTLQILRVFMVHCTETLQFFNKSLENVSSSSATSPGQPMRNAASAAAAASPLAAAPAATASSKPATKQGIAISMLPEQKSAAAAAATTTSRLQKDDSEEEVPRSSVVAAIPSSSIAQRAAKSAPAAEAPVAPPRTSTTANAAPVVAMAEASYTGEQETDLSFNEGDVLLVLEQSPTGWWTARIGESIGSAPSNHLRVLHTPVPVAQGAMLYGYTPQDEQSELRVAKGDKVDILTGDSSASSASGWLLCAARAKGAAPAALGFVPRSYVTIASSTTSTAPAAAIPLAAQQSSRASSASSGSTGSSAETSTDLSMTHSRAAPPASAASVPSRAAAAQPAAAVTAASKAAPNGGATSAARGAQPQKLTPAAAAPAPAPAAARPAPAAETARAKEPAAAPPARPKGPLPIQPSALLQGIQKGVKLKKTDAENAADAAASAGAGAGSSSKKPAVGGGAAGGRQAPAPPSEGAASATAGASSPAGPLSMLEEMKRRQAKRQNKA